MTIHEDNSYCDSTRANKQKRDKGDLFSSGQMSRAVKALRYKKDEILSEPLGNSAN